MPGLNAVLRRLRAGDNVGWLVNDVEEYQPLLGPLLREAVRQRRPLTYFRFAQHASVLDGMAGCRFAGSTRRRALSGL